jgi:hypothetical protein
LSNILGFYNLKLPLTSITSDIKRNPISILITPSGYQLPDELLLQSDKFANKFLYWEKPDCIMKQFITLIAILQTSLFHGQVCLDSLWTPADYDAAIGFHDGTNTANNNYGTAPQNAAYYIPGIAGPYNGNRALIHFSLASIPQTATIVSASLDLYAYYPLGSLPGHTGTNNACFLQRATSAWTEMAVTWSTQPTVSAVNQVSLAGTNTYSLDYLGINVTNLIKDIFAAPNNYGFLLRLQNEVVTNCLSFCSKDNGNPAKVPLLKVYYTCMNTTTGLKEEQADKTRIWPNPFTDKINFSTADNCSITLTDLSGRTVSSAENIQAGCFDASGLCDGMYFMNIEQNGIRQSVKLIKINR